MKKYIIFAILIVGLVLSGCGKKEVVDNQQEEERQTGLANQASVYCEEQGGELEIKENEAGQYGVCKFDDGTECEEWAYFKGECGGEETKNKKENIKNGKTDSSIVAGNDSIKIFGVKSGDNITSPVTIQGEAAAFENNIIVEIRNSKHETLVKEHTAIKSNEVGKKGPYAITLNFQFNNTKEGFIAVYEQSAKDGSEQNLVEIPVRFNTEDEIIDRSKQTTE